MVPLQTRLRPIMTEPALIITALSVGFLGSTHCFAMCGGIASALSLSIPAEQRSSKRMLVYQLLFGLGRISTYALAGFVFASFGSFLSQYLGQNGPFIFRGLAGFFIILIGLYIADWWKILVHLEQAAGGLWKKISPAINIFKPINRPWKAFFIGGIWGWLPCGMVYSVLVWSSAADSAVEGALIMFCFGLGTLPAVIATGSFATTLQQTFQNRTYRRTVGFIIILFGLWTALGPHFTGEHAFHQLPFSS